jgi:hypothetical protein
MPADKLENNLQSLDASTGLGALKRKSTAFAAQYLHNSARPACAGTRMAHLPGIYRSYRQISPARPLHNLPIVSDCLWVSRLCNRQRSRFVHL